MVIDRNRNTLGREFRVNGGTDGSQITPDVGIDREGNLVFLWSEVNTSTGNGYTARWYDKWGSLLADDFQIARFPSSNPNRPTLSLTPAGEFTVAWLDQSTTGNRLLAQRYTVRPPTVLEVSRSALENSIVISFSQEMAVTGPGNALEPANWAIKLPDGRYLVQATPGLTGGGVLVTPEQISKISQNFNSNTGRWEVTISLNIMVPGNYEFVARGSLQDVAGRLLDGNHEGVSSGDFANSITVAITGDFNRDGIVNGADLLLWKTGFGQTSQVINLPGDANFDRIVDGSDFLAWQRNTGSGANALHAGEGSFSQVADSLTIVTTLALPFENVETVGSYETSQLSPQQQNPRVSEDARNSKFSTLAGVDYGGGVRQAQKKLVLRSRESQKQFERLQQWEDVSCPSRASVQSDGSLDLSNLGFGGSEWSSEIIDQLMADAELLPEFVKWSRY